MSADGTIRVAGAELEVMADDLHAATAAIQSCLEDLGASLVRTFGGGWKGRAQLAFQEAKAGWDGQIAEMNAILTEARASVLASRASYAASDQRAAGLF